MVEQYIPDYFEQFMMCTIFAYLLIQYFIVMDHLQIERLKRANTDDE